MLVRAGVPFWLAGAEFRGMSPPLYYWQIDSQDTVTTIRLMRKAKEEKGERSHASQNRIP